MYYLRAKPDKASVVFFSVEKVFLENAFILIVVFVLVLVAVLCYSTGATVNLQILQCIHRRLDN
jgi:hypothetical protein